LDNELIVFAMGSAASFWPLYLGLRKVMSKHSKKPSVEVGRQPISSANRDFLKLLHREAILRANAVLRDALTEASISKRTVDGKNLGLCLLTRQRLEDAQQLIRSVSSSAAQKIYSTAIEEINTATSVTIQRVSEKIARAMETLEETLDSELVDELGRNGLMPASEADLPSPYRALVRVQQHRNHESGRGAQK
jgi:hypothetical protein